MKTTFFVTFTPTDGGKVIERSFSGTSSGSISVPAGKYEITVEAVIDRTAYATSRQLGAPADIPIIAEITSGRNEPINVNMHYIGTGAGDNPFLVYDVETLLAVGRGAANTGRFVSWDNSYKYKLISNINLSGVTWTSITEFAVAGAFDGSGKIIFGLSGGRGFVITNNGKIENLNLVGVNINTNLSAGGIAVLNKGTIQDCSVQGTITSSVAGVGGIAGENNGITGTYARVQNCFFKGTVTGNRFVGGIAGSQSGVYGFIFVSNCFSEAIVQGNVDGVGGIAGSNVGTINNCYALGSVEGNDRVAGIAGTSSGLVENCVALNTRIYAANPSFGYSFARVLTNDSGSMNNNYGRESMILDGNGMLHTLADATSGIDGETLTVSNRGTARSYLSNCPGGAPDLSGY